MKTYLLTAALLLVSTLTFAQLIDDFSDGDFTDAPQWFGLTDKFTVTNQSLQLLDENAASNNTSYLYVPALTGNSVTTTWEFLIQLEFAPSASNFARVYLNASDSNLDNPQDAYYVQIGGISGSDDALELKRQDGNASTTLISGTIGAVGSDPVLARVRVTRSTTGDWELLADYSGGTNFQSEGTANDNTYPFGNFFGLYCKYTSSRADAFFLDDVLVDPLFVDTEPPVLIEANATSANTILVKFNELMDAASAENPANYNLSDGIGNPTSAAFVTGDFTQVELSLGTPLENTTTYTLSVENVADEIGNTANLQTTSFTFYNIQEAAFQDVIISEMMPDPNPSVGLPSGEYIELYNRSDKVIQLSNLYFSSGSTPVQLPDYLLLPDSYVAIVDQDLIAEYENQETILGLANFPALTNGSDVLSITNSTGTLLFEVAYTDDWYRDEIAAEGGYSIELIQLEGPYDCPHNWAASRNTNGGTPGLSNSWLGLIADGIFPRVSIAFAANEMEIEVIFNEQMDVSSITNPAHYTLDNGLTVESINLQNERQVLLSVDGIIQPSLEYTLSLSDGIQDCMGNSLVATTYTIGLAEAASTMDIVINEVLFNPVAGSYDFVELYNRSDKAINLNGLTILNTAKESGDTIAMFEQDYILFPQQYIVFTEDPADILNQYTVLNPDALLENDLPTLEDRSGNITLRLDGISIDSFDYDDDYHYPLLNEEEGVSLERLSPDSPTQDAGNWHSAAATAGFGTPTYQNSQSFQQPTQLDGMIDIPNNTFSPDGDGYEDVLIINYQTDGPGYTLNASIFDSQGRLIRRLLNNETLSNNGTFQWDGTTTEPSKARIGIYVLWFELFTPEGSVEREKKTCVLAGRLD